MIFAQGKQNNGQPEGTGIEIHGARPGYVEDAWHAKKLERFATPEEQVEHLIKTVRHMSDRIRRKDKEWAQKLKDAEHERQVAVRRLAKARDKMKRLNSWMQYG